jgi:hypothetical protein
VRGHRPRGQFHSRRAVPARRDAEEPGRARVTLAWLWLSSAIRAYRAIRARNTADHQRWVTRNYALTFAAVTLRISLPLAAIVGVPFETAYPVIAWLCWVPNLAVAEWRFQSRKPGAGAISSAALN